MKLRVYNQAGQLVPIEANKLVLSEEQWRQRLTPMQFTITRRKGTERAFCGNLLDNKRVGVYVCVCCRLPLFSSKAKFNSGSGWPSFFQPIAIENVATELDLSYGMRRVEILCARCDAHLGHVFPDGPPPTGERHCVNSESLEFVDQADLASLADPTAPNSEPTSSS